MPVKKRKPIGTHQRRVLRKAFISHTLTGDFRMHVAFHSKFLPHPRNVLVYLPPDYLKHKERRYPVLYLHDGQNLFDGATSYIPGNEWEVDETAERLIRNSKIEPLIIVGIYNTGIHRIDEYTPTQDNHLGQGGKAWLYGRLIVEELKPFIDAHYRTLSGRENTGLGGSSLGGLVSLYIGLMYPKVFGKLAILSPSLWWDHFLLVRELNRLSKIPDFRVWLDIGTREGHSAIVPVRMMRDVLVSKGYKLGENLLYREAQGAKHGERAWARRVSPMLQFLFPRKRAVKK